jgi:membrane-associated phospholipid phosphatase
MIQQPWFPEWNYRMLQTLFQVTPHNGITDTLFDWLVRDRLLSTWVFAAAFYVSWAIDDEKTAWRRVRLFQFVNALAIAVVITLIVRPWIAWPAPVMNPVFRNLYPTYFWNNGNLNCFPSHATLAYFMLAAGLWPLSRFISIILGVLVLGLVSLPRVYIGGHYPIDVLASLVIGLAVISVIWQCPVSPSIVGWLTQKGRKTVLRELLLILWVFELGEGFGGTMNLVNKIRHWL